MLTGFINKSTARNGDCVAEGDVEMERGRRNIMMRCLSI